MDVGEMTVQELHKEHGYLSRCILGRDFGDSCNDLTDRMDLIEKELDKRGEL